MSDDESLRRLQLATRLHGAAVPVLEWLLTPPDGEPPTQQRLYDMCYVADAIERAAIDHGDAADEMLQALVKRLRETIRIARAARPEPVISPITSEEMDLIRVAVVDPRPTAAVVCTPGACGGRPRIDGTRLEVSTLLMHLRDGMSVEEISREWSHLPDGWFEAIIDWIDGHGESR